MTNIVASIIDLIEDSIDGPYVGEDFLVNEDFTIEVTNNNVKLAAGILRKINNSRLFVDKLVKVGCHGDVIILGADDMLNTAPIYETKIGIVRVVVKRNREGKFCIYLDGKRQSRMFNKLISCKNYIKDLAITSTILEQKHEGDNNDTDGPFEVVKLLVDISDDK